jgi:IMP cyclohydrolase
MVDTVQLSTGTTVGLSATLPTLFNLSTTGYPARTYTLIGEVMDVPEGGDQRTVVPYNPLASDNEEYLLGSKTHDQITIPIMRDDDDAGQIAVLSAYNNKTEVAFEIEYPDGSIDYFTGLVVSFKSTVGAVNSILARSMVVQRTRSTVTAPAGT